MREMSADTQDLLTYAPVKKTDRFDILISDVHQGGEKIAIDGTTNLTLQEVWEWLCHGGDWAFTITAHGNPDKIFMDGVLNYLSMRAAVDGRMLCYLCEATDAEISELQEKVHKRVLAEIAALQPPRVE